MHTLSFMYSCIHVAFFICLCEIWKHSLVISIRPSSPQNYISSLPEIVRINRFNNHDTMSNYHQCYSPLHKITAMNLMSVCFSINFGTLMNETLGKKHHKLTSVIPSKSHMWCDQAKSVGSRKYWFWDIAKQRKYFLLFPFVLETL